MWVKGSGTSIINTDKLERVMVKRGAGKKVGRVIAVMMNGDRVPLAHFTSEVAYENAVALAEQFVLEISGQDRVMDAKALCNQAK
jgi:leucyl aminopeptidase (aminopeptidase T)